MTPEQLIDREVADFMAPFPPATSSHFLKAIKASFLAGISAGAIFTQRGDIADSRALLEVVQQKIKALQSQP